VVSLTFDDGHASRYGTCLLVATAAHVATQTVVTIEFDDGRADQAVNAGPILAGLQVRRADPACGSVRHPCGTGLGAPRPPPSSRS
jgi:hypothetical protein